MGLHEPVDGVLAPSGPLAVVLPHRRRTVAQDVRYQLEGGTLFEESRCQCTTVPVCMGVLHPGFIEYGGESPFRNP